MGTRESDDRVINLHSSIILTINGEDGTITTRANPGFQKEKNS